MSCSLLLVERLRTELGLPDRFRKDVPEGKWSRVLDERSGLPPKSEFYPVPLKISVDKIAKRWHYLFVQSLSKRLRKLVD